jgi:miniconductance mechanosensitive channel
VYRFPVNDMIRIEIGVTMDKFGADGDVIEINSESTVKVRKFEILPQPFLTHSLSSDFQNWRGNA